MPKVPLRDIFRPAFWLNYVFSLVVTLWVPFAHLRFTDEKTGKVIRESYPAVYEIYLDVIQKPNTWTAYKYIAAHLGLVFIISVIVWYLVALRQSKQAAQVTASNDA